MNVKPFFAAASCAIAGFSVTVGVQAQTSPADHVAHHPAAPAAAASAADPLLTDAEVSDVDAAQKQVTLRHGPIEHLQMPAMTMVFQVADAKLLDKLTVGDKVRFAVERSAGAFVVTAIERAAQP